MKKPRLQYIVNGKPIKNPSVNRLSGVAYFHTKGIDGLPRISTGRLKALLEAKGATDPRSIPFAVTLPNGKELAGVPMAEPVVLPVPVAPEEVGLILPAEPQWKCEVCGRTEEEDPEPEGDWIFVSPSLCEPCATRFDADANDITEPAPGTADESAANPNDACVSEPAETVPEAEQLTAEGAQAEPSAVGPVVVTVEGADLHWVLRCSQHGLVCEVSGDEEFAESERQAHVAEEHGSEVAA